MQITVIFSAFFITIIAIMVLYPIALKLGLTDHPSHRKQHTAVTPLIGGLACFLAIVITMLINDGYFPNQQAYILAGALLVFVGFVDDYKELGIKIRLAAQIGATLIMTEMAGLKIIDLGDLFLFGDIHLGVFSTLFTLFAVVGGVNAFNMIDGIDGLAGGLTFISVAVIAVIAELSQEIILLTFCCLFLAVIGGFLLFNARIFGRLKAKIFLGDAGSTLFGFTVCWLAISISQGEHPLISPSLVLWIITVPLLDSVCIMLRRLTKGRSPFAADREHLHHILSLAGFSVNKVLVILLGVSLILSIIGGAIEYATDDSDAVLFVLFLMMFVGFYWCISHAWLLMKVIRYLRTLRDDDKKIGDRRKKDRRVHSDACVMVQRRDAMNRSEVTDRRHIPSQQQLNLISGNKNSIRKVLMGLK